MIDETLFAFIEYVKSKNGIGNKMRLMREARKKFKLTKDRSVYYSEYFAVRFSFSSSANFSNTVISLSNLQKYDDLPFVVCLVMPKQNILYLANTTFLQKISHSSQELREDNIRGSFNGSDIVKEFNGLKNAPENFGKLFSIHAGLGFGGNLVRLVEATTNISPSGNKMKISSKQKLVILSAVDRAKQFVKSKEYLELKDDLDSKVQRYKNEILIAGFIENVNIRGRIIEYLIAGEDEKMKTDLIEALRKSSQKIPGFRTKNTLGDYVRIFKKYQTATDVKTKILILSSNPKGYNIDKLLEFLSSDQSVFMFYFIGLEPDKIVNQILVSMFQVDLLRSTIVLKHWSGRNSRGVTQFEGDIIHKLIVAPDNHVDKKESDDFLKMLIKL
ncbi:MAG: hypothetical protein A2261_01405 [Candidatus Magasanikbacteria bacterium RIFOXYA2_FULL_44_8]|uniref:DraI n=1 Tax=Candidatus Magasanikbacteria bacterium RIFOXYA2_FULL_44_8 TaxID=1798696 RepID=A0A1F6NLV9_9BACT|nr:MAG: hypothetical protein A2261_01405 [Candidatus Magasanikbacteria bacterium RIFOXYA2_FULL_44_8]